MRHIFFRQLLFALCLTPILACSCLGTGGSSKNKPQDGQPNASSAPVQYTYEIVNTYPHSTTSYTQGLYWHDGYLWEGTGEYRRSALQKVVLETGQIIERHPLDDDQFGEGIALLNGRIYQITWLNGLAFVYDAATRERTGQFTYSGEGWGLTTDGEKLYMTDGSHKIYEVDPEDFSRTKTHEVRIGNRPVYNLNELEWIEGRIWANIYESDAIVIFDPAADKVEGVVDLSGILPKTDRTPDTNVLNGIAYDPDTKRIFVTGKNWSKLFEITISKKE